MLPYQLVKWGVERINREGQPVVIYLHPWELDPGQPRIQTRYLNSFRHYVNLDKTEGKLRRLLRDFEFATIRDYLTGLEQRDEVMGYRGVRERQRLVVGDQRNALMGDRVAFAEPRLVMGKRNTVMRIGDS